MYVKANLVWVNGRWSNCGNSTENVEPDLTFIINFVHFICSHFGLSLSYLVDSVEYTSCLIPTNQKELVWGSVSRSVRGELLRSTLVV